MPEDMLAKNLEALEPVDGVDVTVSDKKVRMSRREIIRGLAAGSVVAYGAGCAYNEELGRSQLLFVSSDRMAQLASSAWTDLKRQEQVTNDPRYVNRMRRVAPKIIQASGNNPSQWEVQVFASKQLNAFALPGRKIGFYTGILDIMENDDQIATVMGHEVAHVNYNHSGERYSQSTLAQTGLSVAQIASSGSQYSNQIVSVLGMGASLGVILPFSRRHELEADRFGLRYMARAGYNPNESVRFWQKMSQQKSGNGAPPEFMSTHPSDQTRIAQLQREIALLGQS
ncbi:MAG: M48 family metallopeptidase [Pseudomonadota bacterium]